jgi:predicted TIM-barrel fold metal-dependent hydrolase
VQAVLEAHLQAGDGRMRGIRHISTYSDEPALASIYHWKTPDLLLDAKFREGFARLEPLGLSFDAWLFHNQHDQLLSLARAFPETQIVVDHLGGPLFIGSQAGQPELVYKQWSVSIRQLASCPNVFMKLGGLGLPTFALGIQREDRPSSETLARAWRPFIEPCIEAFGPARCMFESNFPNDKLVYDYGVGWNAFKRITRAMSAEERRQLFSGTARRFYRLPSIG